MDTKTRLKANFKSLDTFFIASFSFLLKFLMRIYGTATNAISDTLQYVIRDKHHNATNVITEKRHN